MYNIRFFSPFYELSMKYDEVIFSYVSQNIGPGKTALYREPIQGYMIDCC